MLYIVYIENDQASRFSFEQITATLRARGFDNYLYLYNTLEEAFDSIPLERPDIVFFELRPRSKQAPSNLDFVRLLRQHPLCTHTSLVAMAEFILPADRSAALSAGCHAFLQKPVRYPAVEATINRLVFGALP